MKMGTRPGNEVAMRHEKGQGRDVMDREEAKQRGLEVDKDLVCLEKL